MRELGIVCRFVCGRALPRLLNTRVSPSGPRPHRFVAVSAKSPQSHSGREKKLFTPGPLGTSLTVRQAAIPDLGSRDVIFIEKVKHLRSRLVQIAGVSEDEFTTVPIQGSGTFAVEAVLQTAVPRNGAKALLLENGAYGKRITKMCDYIGIPYHEESFPENQKVDINRVAEILKGDNSFSFVSVVHCETSSGVINPVVEVGALVRETLPECVFFVDAMSSFGAVPLDMQKGCVDFMVSSANKCLQGIPGFSYAIARKSALEKCKVKQLTNHRLAALSPRGVSLSEASRFILGGCARHGCCAYFSWLYQASTSTYTFGVNQKFRTSRARNVCNPLHQF